MPLKGGVSACPAGNLKQHLHTAGFGDSQSGVVGNATKNVPASAKGRPFRSQSAPGVRARCSIYYGRFRPHDRTSRKGSDSRPTCTYSVMLAVMRWRTETPGASGLSRPSQLPAHGAVYRLAPTRAVPWNFATRVDKKVCGESDEVAAAPPCVATAIARWRLRRKGISKQGGISHGRRSG